MKNIAKALSSRIALLGLLCVSAATAKPLPAFCIKVDHPTVVGATIEMCDDGQFVVQWLRSPNPKDPNDPFESITIAELATGKGRLIDRNGKFFVDSDLAADLAALKRDRPDAWKQLTDEKAREVERRAKDVNSRKVPKGAPNRKDCRWRGESCIAKYPTEVVVAWLQTAGHVRDFEKRYWPADLKSPIPPSWDPKKMPKGYLEPNQLPRLVWFDILGRKRISSITYRFTVLDSAALKTVPPEYNDNTPKQNAGK